MVPSLRIAHSSVAIAALSLALACKPQAAPDRFASLAGLPFEQNRPAAATARTLEEELLFQRATQTYLWAMPLINTMGMRDGFAESFGTGYNTMAIWTKRLDARTHITTPNSDLIYGMVFVNLAETGPLVFEAPPKLQGILLDFWQHPIPADGGKFFGDVGLPGPDAGAGGKFLLLPPGYSGAVPHGYYLYRSGTNNVFIFLRSFYTDLADITPAVDVLKRARLYPLGKEATAEPMKFLDASTSGHEMLPRPDVTAFRDLKYLVDTEGSGLADPDWLGMLATLGIIKGVPFAPDARTTEILTAAAATAYKMSRVIGLQGKRGDVDLRVYPDRQWVNPVINVGSPSPMSRFDQTFTSLEGDFRVLDARIWFFTDYYSLSPGMMSRTPGQGAFYAVAFTDSEGHPLVGAERYTVTLPPNVPAELFWSVTLYEAENGSGLANGQPFPSLGKLNKPAANTDGSITLHLGPTAPAGAEGNWLATVPGRGYFAILRLYAPTAPALDKSWKPGDIVKVR